MDMKDSRAVRVEETIRHDSQWSYHANDQALPFDPSFSPRLRHNSTRSGYGYFAATPDVSVDRWGKRARPSHELPSRPTPKTLEDVHIPPSSPRKPSRLVSRYLSRVNWNSQPFWLGLYFSLNLFLTLSNKSVLTGFPYPYTLTAIHALCSACGGVFLRSRGLYAPKRLSFHHEMVLVAFSFLYSINIAVSNVSLHLVTVPLHQVIRALSPVFTMAISFLLFNTRTGPERVYPLIPVMFGVGLATYGDYDCTAWGLCLTLLGTFLAALKTIHTGRLQSSVQPPAIPPTPRMPEPALWRPKIPGERAATWSSPFSTCGRAWRHYLAPPPLDLHPLDLLTRMSPLAFAQCVAYAHLSGELDRLARFGAAPPSQTLSNGTGLPVGLIWNGTALIDCRSDEIQQTGGVSPAQAFILLLNGCLAFGLNIVSFSANGKVGALSMTVAANVKQVLTILFAVSLFNLRITFLNTAGIAITLIGGAWYAWVEYTAKIARNKAAS